MTSIKLQQPNYNLREIHYPDLNEIYKLGRRTIWNEDEIRFESDKLDWEVRMTEEERAFVGRVLKGFTTTELIVNDHWRTIAKTYPRPEVSSICSLFSYQESVHAHAYNKLEEELGLDTYQEFISDRIAKRRFDNIWEQLADGDIGQLAVFSCVEGISLFSSFLLLLAFTYRKNYLVNIKDILGWSLLDESIHSLVGTKLVGYILKERKTSWTEKEIKYLDRAIRNLIEIELSFARSCFGEVDFLPEIITYEEVEDYVMERAADLLSLLNLDVHIRTNYTPHGDTDLSQFMRMLHNTTHGDFFAQGKLSDSYTTRANINWGKVKITR